MHRPHQEGDRFKAAVERNFDESAEAYDAFEERHGLFESLTRRLCELIAPAVPSRILDVGCGTGISALALRRALPYSPVVYGIDVSEKMLIRARARCAAVPGIYFVRGDATRLADYFRETFDAVFYTASIFLIPDFKGSMEQACRLVVPRGVIALSFYAGLFDAERRDALEIAFPGLRYQYGAVKLPELEAFMASRRGLRTTRVDYHFEVSPEFLFDFLAIPAQSAGLFPKMPHPDRVGKVRELCAGLVEKVSPVYMGWTFLIARKG